MKWNEKKDILVQFKSGIDTQKRIPKKKIIVNSINIYLLKAWLSNMKKRIEKNTEGIIFLRSKKDLNI